MIGYSQRKLAQLEKEQRQQAQFQTNDAWYSFLARPTCSPSTSISIHGGTCISAASLYWMDDVGRGEGVAWTVPNLQRNLTEETQARVDMGWTPVDQSYTEVTWGQANSYKGGILLLVLPDTEDQPSADDWRVRLFCFREEYQNANDCEARLIAWLWEEEELAPPYTPGYYDGHYWPSPIWRWAGQPYLQDTGMPLCGLILRNNGTTGTGRYFMEIDAVNRGRSYTWPRDLRPQWVNT